MHSPTDILAARIKRLAPQLDELVVWAIAEDAVAVLRPRLVDAKSVAEQLGMSRDWVYANAGRLGARVIGDGTKRPRKRFYLHEVAAAVDDMSNATPQPAETLAPVRRRRPVQSDDSVTPAGNPRLGYTARPS